MIDRIELRFRDDIGASATRPRSANGIGPTTNFRVDSKGLRGRFVKPALPQACGRRRFSQRAIRGSCANIRTGSSGMKVADRYAPVPIPTRPQTRTSSRMRSTRATRSSQSRTAVQNPRPRFGYDYLKLDFLFAAAAEGTRHDPGLTRAQTLRRGLEAIRRGAGKKTFILGCGCPLGPAIGIVDGMRIGPDVAPHWERRSWRAMSALRSSNWRARRTLRSESNCRPTPRESSAAADI